MGKNIALAESHLEVVDLKEEIVLEVKEVKAISVYGVGEEMVRKEFTDTPRMIPIVKCESGFQQFKDGKPLISKTSDAGIMQINQVHWKRAWSLGLDIFNSTADNIKMGRIILKEQGLKAWTCNKLV